MSTQPAVSRETLREGDAAIRWPVWPLPVHPLLFAAYPVLFLFAQNLGDVLLRDVVPPAGRYAIAAAAIWLFASVALRDLRRGAIVASALVVFWTSYGHVAGLLARSAVPRDVQLLGWAVSIGVAVLAAVLLRGAWIGRLTTGLNVAAAVLLGLTLVQIVPYQLSHPTAAVGTITSRPAGPGARDIWFLVFDRYGSERSLRAYADVDNDLPAWLAGQGFLVEPDAHANYGRTSLSLAATLNITTLDEVAQRMGPGSRDPAPINAMLSDHLVGRFLKERGYRYIHLGSWYGPTRSPAIADRNPLPETSTDFEAILEDTTFQPTLDDLRDVPEIPHNDVVQRESALFQFAELRRVMEEPGPKFVVGHIIVPHPPYVFDVDGSYVPKEVQRALPPDEPFRRQLAWTNDQIRQIVELLLRRPEAERPVIVLTADEGPYPPRYEADQSAFRWEGATDDELETKFGILMAFYLPGDPPAGALEPYPTITAWNTFPIILDRYFGADFQLLPDRVYTSWGQDFPYRLTDVTARLPSLPSR
jgi:hypothetical protein